MIYGYQHEYYLNNVDFYGHSQNPFDQFPSFLIPFVSPKIVSLKKPGRAKACMLDLCSPIREFSFSWESQDINNIRVDNIKLAVKGLGYLWKGKFYHLRNLWDSDPWHMCEHKKPVMDNRKVYCILCYNVMTWYDNCWDSYAVFVH